MRALLLLTVLLLAGCFRPMTNEEIIAESKACADAGLSVLSFYSATGMIINVQCHPGGPDHDRTHQETAPPL